VAKFTQGIPRNVNNFCFNAFALACALQKTTVDADIANEVISDMDISRFTSAAQPQSPRFEPLTEQIPSEAPARNGADGEILTPAEAAAYMQEVVLKLRSGSTR